MPSVSQWGEGHNANDSVIVVIATVTSAKVVIAFIVCLQCFDAVGWVVGRAPGL